MAFDLHIKNIGKLTDAKLRIGQFTVLAGPNNTGKSFVSKILYSLFDAMNANHAEVQMEQLTAPVRDNFLFRRFRWRENADESMDTVRESSPLDEMRNKIRAMNRLATEQSFDDLSEVERFLVAANDIAQSLPDLLPGIRSLLETPPKRLPRFMLHRAKDSFAELEQSLHTMQKKLADMNAQQFISAGIDHTAESNLIRNFQISNLARLHGAEMQESKISSDVIGEFDLIDGRVKFSIPHSGLQMSETTALLWPDGSGGFTEVTWGDDNARVVWDVTRRYPKVIYLESPVHWKIKNALEYMHFSDRRRWSAHREHLTGIPGYFYDLASMLRSEFTGEMDFPKPHARLISEHILGGKLIISEAGEILFHEMAQKNGQEKAQNFPLSLTSTGIINLGILALLIERKILDKGTFVFIDEPEAHLHPAWQVVMAESLLELAKDGAYVVIATHSIDILKWLEVHAKKNPEDKENLIELNQFSSHGVEGGSRDFDEKMARILQELTDPFAKNFIDGV